MDQGLERIPLAVDSDFQYQPVRANFPEPKVADQIKIVGFEADAPLMAPDPEAPAKRSMGEAVADTGVQLAEGVNTILGAVPNLVSPEGKVAGFFNDNAQFWRDKQSGPLKSKIANADQAITQAGEDGVLSQIAEAASQYFGDPALAARFVTTNLPSMIPGVSVAKVAQAAALAKGASAVRAAQIATSASGAANAALNAGGARGEAFEDIKRTLIQQGMSQEQAEQKALEDSRIVAAVGGIAGYLSGKTGLEKSLVGQGAAKSAVKSRVGAAAAELAGEQVEEVAPQIAANVQAGQYDNRSIGKDVGRTIVETAIGTGPGAVVAGGMHADGKPVEKTLGEPVTTGDDGGQEPAVSGVAGPSPGSAPGLPNIPLEGEFLGRNELPPGQRLLDAPPIDGEFSVAGDLQPRADDAHEGEVTGPDALPAGQKLLEPPAIDAEFTPVPDRAPAPVDLSLPSPTDGGPSLRSVAAARGLLNHHRNPSPELLMRVLGHDADTAARLFAHWQANDRKARVPALPSPERQGNGANTDRQADAEMASARTADAGGDLPGSGAILASSSAGDHERIGDRAEVAAPGVRPAVVAGSDGAPSLSADEAQPSALDVQAHGAATSPFNGHAQPTEAQKRAGNYRKGKVSIQGLDISIENPAGSVRSGSDADGKPWQTEMQNHYGYIRGTVGRDKDHLDVFLGPKAEDADTAFVIDQINPKTGRFDEHKIVLGAESEQEARDIYHANYQKGWKGLSAVTSMPMAEFKTWIASGNTKSPLGKQSARTYPKSQAEQLAKRLTLQGLPSEAYPHPSGDGAYAIRSKALESRASANAVYNDDHGLPEGSSTDRAVDQEELASLRRSAAGLERPKSGIFLRVEPDGRAISAGPKGARIPETFRRFAHDNGLRFYAERRVPQYAPGTPASSSGTFSGNSEPMPIAYRESGAHYFGEDVGGGSIDRTGNTKFSIGNDQGGRTRPSMAQMVSDINGVVERFKMVFKGSAVLNVRVVGTVDDIPTQFRPSIYAEGVYHDDVGLIYLVAENLQNRDGAANTARAFQVLMHESVGHYGLASMMGDRFRGIFKHVMQVASDPKIAKEINSARVNKEDPDIYGVGDDGYATVEAVRLRYPDASDEDVAQEVMARMAESEPGSTRFGYIRAVIRQWFRDMARAMGFGVAVTTDELIDLVAKASVYLRAGKNLETEIEPTGLVAASRKNETVERDRTNIETAMRRIAKFVDAFLSSQVRDSDTQLLGPTPAVLLALGADDLQLRIDGETVRKMISGKHQHTMSEDIVKRLPMGIYDPLMVFDSPDTRTGEPGKLLVTEDVDRLGNQVVSLVHLAKKDGRMVVNDLASAYGLEDIENRNKTSPDKLQYVRNEKGLASSTTPNLLKLAGVVQKARDLGVNILSEADIVNTHGARYSLGRGMESRRHVAGDSGRQYSAAQQQTFRNIGREVETPTIKERVAGLWAGIGKKLQQGIADQFAPLKDLDEQAYLLSRMSKAADGALEAMLMYGRVFLNGGIYDVNVKDGGVIDKLLRPLGKEADDFMWWIAGNRAEQLASEEREHLMTPADIASLKALSGGQLDFDYTLQNGKVTRDRAAAYRDAQQIMTAFNKSVLDIAEQSGLIDGAERSIWERDFYVPFYREAEEGEKKFPSVKKGLVRQKAFERLKGGSDKLNHDLLANTLMNWSHMLNAAAKNRAAKASLEAAERAGVATKAPSGEKGSVYYRDAGKEVHYTVDDPFVLDAITALEFSGFSGPAMRVMGTFKRWLTMGVTASPTFKIRNLIRDSISAIGQGELSYNPLKNIGQGYKATDKQSQTYASMLAGGGIIRFGTMIEGNRADHVRRLVEAGVDPGTIIDSENKLQVVWKRYVMPAVDAYNELGDRSEGINRAALYEQLRAKGVSHAEASFAARDLLDFSMGGTSSAVRFLTQVVPFANARIQGLYKLGRAAKENPKRMGYVVGAVALASLALLAAYHDDDDWKKREDWDRDSYWWFKVGGVAFRIPKPFEIGAMGTLAERSAELLFDKEMDGARFGERLRKMVGDTFAMNPVPQMFKPLLDLYANTDSFTGRPIETMGMEKMSTADRFTARTSEIAKIIGKAGVLSPVQIDHLIRGYFGWMGTAAMTFVDQIVRAGDDNQRPSMRLRDVFLAGNFVETLPSNTSRYVTQMYEQAKEIEEAYNSWRHYLKVGDTEKANQVFAEKKDDISRYRQVQSVKRVEAASNAKAQRIETDRKKTGDQKRMELDKIAAQKDKAARSLGSAGLK